MSLKQTRKLFEEFGAADPMFAVLSEKSLRGNRWNPDEFFATGRQEIAASLEVAQSLGVPLHKGTALDFGCGVGRLTQALCEYFQEVTGLDISYSMIEAAGKFNQHGERCKYLCNTRADLALLPDKYFDFVYTDKVLQHMHPDFSSAYILEFFRVLKPGGMAMFQIPSGKPVVKGSPGEKWYNLKTGPLRRFWKRVRGMQPVEMHHIHRSQVEELIDRAGGQLVKAVQRGSVRRHRTSYFYCAIRP